MTDRRSRLLTFSSELLVCAVLSLCWLPFPGEWTTAIPQGREEAATVPLFNAWTIAWNIDRARDGWRGYWAAAFFYPAPNTFSLCEAQPQTALLAPLESWQGLAFAYNVYLAATLTLNGWVACRWLEAIGARGAARLWGGLLVQTLPFVHWQFGVLQLVPVWGILWTWTAVWRYCEQPKWGAALSAGLAFGCTYWLCNYYGLFLSLLMPCMAPALLAYRRIDWRLVAHALGAGLVAAAMIAPIARMQLQADRHLNLSRQLGTVQQLSLQPSDLTKTPTERFPVLALSRFENDGKRGRWTMGMGTLVYLAGAVGGSMGLFRQSQRRVTALMWIVIAAACLLATGPDGIAGVRPYAWLMDWYPGLSKVRSPFRFVIFLQLAVVTLAVVLADSAWVSKDRWMSTWRRRVQGIVAAAVAILVVSETWPGRAPTCGLPDLNRNAGWCRWLTMHTEPRSPIVCLPFSPGTRVVDHLGDVEWMHFGRLHHNRLCNGYAAYFPQTYRQLREPLKSFPNRESLQSLAALSVETVVVRRDVWAGAEDQRAVAEGDGVLTRLFADDTAEVDIWKIGQPLAEEPGSREAENRPSRAGE